MGKKKNNSSMVGKAVTAAETALTLYTLQDVAKQKDFKMGNKLIWTPIVTFGKFVGPAAYYMFGRKSK